MTDQPTNSITITRHIDGRTESHTMRDNYGTAAQAQANLTARLRDRNIPIQSGPGWIEYHDSHPIAELAADIRIEWVDNDA